MTQVEKQTEPEGSCHVSVRLAMIVPGVAQ
jgi:hypothetical protein